MRLYWRIWAHTDPSFFKAWTFFYFEKMDSSIFKIKRKSYELGYLARNSWMKSHIQVAWCTVPVWSVCQTQQIALLHSNPLLYLDVIIATMLVVKLRGMKSLVLTIKHFMVFDTEKLLLYYVSKVFTSLQEIRIHTVQSFPLNVQRPRCLDKGETLHFWKTMELYKPAKFAHPMHYLHSTHMTLIIDIRVYTTVWNTTGGILLSCDFVG